ncbi:transposase [Candidatus Magnetomorum sp. HK-1]|nr:transposase [Candidatus Magnetomorum sp. HK-1]
MKTDKELYKIFSAYPNYLFKCASIRKKTTYTMQSVTLKEFERRTDGLLAPKDPKAPTYITEFQAQKDANIYHRLAMEMAAVFKPLFEKDLNALKNNAYHWYQKIAKSRLPKDAKEHIQKAFISWLTARLRDLPYQEVINMIASLPDFETTQFYKDIVEVGEKRGEKRGEKKGEKSIIVKEINRFEKMKKKGDINEILFKKLCDPLQKELDKLTAEIDTIMNKPQ